jgi:hypothetical protein
VIVNRYSQIVDLIQSKFFKKMPLGQANVFDPKGILLANHLFLLLLGFSQYFLKEFLIHKFAFGDILAVLNEVDGIDTCDLLAIESTEPKVGLSHHVGG